MNNRESLDEFLSQFNRKQQWARVFAFAMTALGLFVVVGLVGLTVWGFASYDSARNSLSDTSQKLEVSQKKIGELETLVSSNPGGAEVVRLQARLSETEKIVTEKDALIANLEKQLQSTGSPTPSNPVSVPPDCTLCKSIGDAQITDLQKEIRNLKVQLENCKRGRGKAGSSTTENKTVILQ